MIEEIVYRIRIPVLIARLAKGDSMTVKEERELNKDIRALAQEAVWVLQDAAGEGGRNRLRSLTSDQMTFVRTVLPLYIREGVPKLAEVCAVYGINMDTDTLVCKFETTPFEF